MKATPREKALLFALAAGYIDNWIDCYKLSREKPTEEAEKQDIKVIRTIVTRWKQRPGIKEAYESALLFLKTRDSETARKASEEARREMEGGQEETTGGDSERTKQPRNAKIDYYDPKNQRRTINAIIDKAQDDPKTQLDAIKAIQQTQRDDRQAAKDNQIQRFYTPVTCHQCPLYQKRPKKS